MRKYTYTCKKYVSILISLGLVVTSMPQPGRGGTFLSPPSFRDLNTLKEPGRSEDSKSAPVPLWEERTEDINGTKIIQAQKYVAQLMNNDFFRSLLEFFKEDSRGILKRKELIRTIRPYAGQRMIQAMIVGELGLNGEHILIDKRMEHFRFYPEKWVCVESELMIWERAGIVHDINFNAKVGHGLASEKFKAVSFTYINLEGKETHQKILYSSEGVPNKKAQNEGWYKYIKKHDIHAFFCEDWRTGSKGYDIIKPALKKNSYVLLDKEIEYPELSLIKHFKFADENYCPLYFFDYNFFNNITMWRARACKRYPRLLESLQREFQHWTVSNAFELPWQEFVRFPKLQPEPISKNQWNYFSNQHEVRVEFLLLLSEMAKWKISNEKERREKIQIFKNRLREIHRILMLGFDGKSRYISPVMEDDIRKNNIVTDEYLEKNDITTVDYFDNIADQFIKYNPRIAFQIESIFVNLQDILKPSPALNTYNEIIRHIANLIRFWHNGWLFDYGYNSLLMNMVNAMLRLYGMNGISHARLDRKAAVFKISKENFQELFLQKVIEVNPDINDILTKKAIEPSFVLRLKKQRDTETSN